MNYNFAKYTFFAFIVLYFSACQKKEYQTIDELDSLNIQEYIRKNNLNVKEFDDSGIFYTIIEEGSGQELAYENKVPLVFTLKTLDGSYSALDTFSTSNRYYDYLGYFPYGSGAANSPGSPLDKDEGMKMLLKETLKRANGKVRIIVPSRLAFGRNGTRDIPPNSSLDYIIHAIDVDSLPNYEDASIRQYIVSENMQVDDFTKTNSGIYYKIEKEGSGDFVDNDKAFKASYDLKLLDGKSIQTADSVTFSLTNVIAAWQEVMPKVKDKGKVRMLIPSSQAYRMEGSTDSNTGTQFIPPFSSLDFEVEVVGIIE